jgi:glycosyltransferase involved in cell wall biosynthesis
MADTLERSLRSLFTQLDERFEIVVVDDGSGDGSLDVLRRLQQEHEMKIVPLQRDPKRKLGGTRNISIQEASGTYVLLHLDCDDVFGPYLADFTQVFHRLEKVAGGNILVSGAHVNMARRDFLLEHGGYVNMSRGQDRELWARMAAMNAWIPLDHIDFITRLPKKKIEKMYRGIFYTLAHMQNDFRLSPSSASFIRLVSLQFKGRSRFALRYFLLRLMLLVPAKILALRAGPLPSLGPKLEGSELSAYRARQQGTFTEIMERHGTSGELAFLREEARHIFASGQGLWG